MLRYLFTIILLTVTFSRKTFASPKGLQVPPGFILADGFVFPGSINSNTPILIEDTKRVTSPPINRNPRNFQHCFNICPTTPQFNPICGTDGVQYDNEGKFKCAKYCGKPHIQVAFLGRCKPLLPSVG